MIIFLTHTYPQERINKDIYFNIYYGSLEYLLWKVEKERVASSKAYEKDRKNWGGDDDEDVGGGDGEEDEEEDGKMFWCPRNTLILPSPLPPLLSSFLPSSSFFSPFLPPFSSLPSFLPPFFFSFFHFTGKAILSRFLHFHVHLFHVLLP